MTGGGRWSDLSERREKTAAVAAAPAPALRPAMTASVVLDMMAVVVALEGGGLRCWVGGWDGKEVGGCAAIGEVGR